MLLSELTATSAAVAGTSGRLEKVGLLADFLKRLSPDEIEMAVTFLSGATRQGRIGLSSAGIAAARFSVALFQPVQPMLAESADDVVDALTALGAASTRRDAGVRRGSRSRARARSISSSLPPNGGTAAARGPSATSTWARGTIVAAVS